MELELIGTSKKSDTDSVVHRRRLPSHDPPETIEELFGEQRTFLRKNGDNLDSDAQIQKELVEGGNLPRHIAVIMDGNGRWAKKRGLSRNDGHRAGVKSVRDIVRTCGELHIEVLTLYAFSSENWIRPKEEVLFLMRLIKDTVSGEFLELHKNNVKLVSIGRMNHLPRASRLALLRVIKNTSKNSGLMLNLAVDYGGRSEIVEAVREIASRVEKGKLKSSQIDEQLFSQFLYTAELPEPDLLIRTSGEMRLSNFLLWQMAYTEIWVTPVYWPDFTKEHLYEAMRNYQSRERRFGGLEST